MLEIDREMLNVPSFFLSSELQPSRRHLQQLFLASRDKRDQSRILPTFQEFDARFADEVRDAFHGRCAFCEDIGPGSAMRLRPETEAEPVRDAATTLGR